MNSLFPASLLLLLYGFVEGGAKNYDAVLNSLEHKERLVFDVSTPLNRKLKEVGKLGRNGTFEFLDQLRVRLSPIVYWKRERDRNYRRKSSSIKVWEEEFYLFGSAFLHHSGFFSTRPLTPKHVETLFNQTNMFDDQDFVIGFNLQKTKFSLSHLHTFIRLEKRWRKEDPLFGVEYNPLSTDSTRIQSAVILVTVVIVKVDIPPMFPLSYSVFKGKLLESLKDTYKFVDDANLNCKIYAKLNFQKNDTDSVELYGKYYLYLLQFSVFWLNDGERARLILPCFWESQAFQNGLDGLPSKKISDVAFFPTHFHHLLKTTGICAVKAWLDQVTPYFGNLVMQLQHMFNFFKGNILNCLIGNGTNCSRNEIEREICGIPPKHLLYLPNISLSTQMSETRITENFEDFFSNLKRRLEGLPWAVMEVAIEPFAEFQPALPNVPPELRIRCVVGRDDYHDMEHMTTELFEKGEEFCTLLWNQSEAIVLKAGFVLGNAQLWTEALIEYSTKSGKFSRNFPGKSIIPLIQLPPVGHGRHGLYCNFQIRERNEAAEAAVHFARTHGFFVRNEEGLPWSVLETIAELDMGKTRFPVFVVRNSPDHFLFEEIPNDPCISWTEKVDPAEGILIDNAFGGSTLNLGELKGEVNPEELYILLQLILHKFSLVEVVVSSTNDLKTVVAVLDKHDFGGRRVSLELYFRLDWKLLKNLEIEVETLLEKFSQVKTKPAGIHFVNWNNKSSIFGRNHSIRQAGSGIKLGLELEDCVAEVNAGFSNLRRILSAADYLLCNILHPVEASNANIPEMERYLDTTLYIQKYFQRLFPIESEHISLLYRLNPKAATKEINPSTVRVFVGGKGKRVPRQGLDNFLAFISDVNQYAGKYKLKFFMVSAFDNPFGNGSGWWTILDFNDLANSSAFIEKEAQQLGKETWRPLPEVSEKSRLDPPSPMFIIASVLGVGLLLLLSVILVLYVFYRRRFTVLTRKEVADFRRGTFANGMVDNLNSFLDLKFPEEFEIGRHSIELLNMIGRGAFGLVYRATINIGSNQQVDAAVKMPNSDCPKAFKSMLMEVKILCFVGMSQPHHPNVIGFLGAYTREIGSGVIYIATEYCKHGALLEYLRKLETETGDVENGDEVADQQPLPSDIETGQMKPNELCRFCHEIAQGMEFISKLKIVHGDLSSRNVMLDSNLNCKITDFGLSRRLYEYQKYVKTNSEPLPWRWMAVETLKRMEFTTKSDVWSYGITMWEIFSLGSIPYPGLTWTAGFVEQLENGLRMVAPQFASREIFQKMCTCWEMDPDMRPTFSELCHFFILYRGKDYIDV